MSTIINGISCEEISQSPDEAIDEQGLHARQSFLCDWASRYKVANGLLGFIQRPPGSVGGTFTYSLPRQYPDSPNMFAKRIFIEGKGKPTDSGTQVQYTKAIVRAEYGTLPWVAMRAADPGGLNSFDPSNPYIYATQELGFSVQYLRVHPATIKYSDGTKVQDYFNRRIPICDLSLTLNRVPYLPTATILSTIGSCNNATFLGAATGKLLFNGARSRAGASSDGTYTQDLTLSFSFRSQLRWDYGLPPNATSFAPLQIQYQDGTAVVPSADLTQLIPSFYVG